MTGRQDENLRMCRAVRQVCDGNAAAWTGNAAFAGPYAEFTALLDSVDAAVGRQGISSKGTTSGKNALRHTLEGQALHVANTLVLHFKLINDSQSQQEMYVTPSLLKLMTEDALTGRLSRIFSVAADITPATLTALGLDPTELTAAFNNLNAFTAAISSPRKIIAQSVLGTQQVETIIDAMVEILKDDLDVVANVLQFSKPEFVSEYRTARKIVDNAVRVRELTVTVSAAGAGIGGAQCQITPGNIHKVTGPKGSFYIQNLDGGTYTGVITALGYKPKTVEFGIIDNQPTVLNVTLEPEA
jgi:hypothetical protein